MRLGWPYHQSSSWKVSSAESQPAEVTAVEKGEAVGFVVFFVLPEMWRRDSGQSFGKGLKGEGRFCLSRSQRFASDFLTCSFFLPSFQNSNIRQQIIEENSPPSRFHFVSFSCSALEYLSTSPLPAAFSAHLFILLKMTVFMFASLF